MAETKSSEGRRFDRRTLRYFFIIAKPFFFGDAKWKAIGLLVVLISFSMGVNGLNVLLSYVNRDFTTALAQREEEKFYKYLFISLGMLAVATPISVLYRFTEERLALLWRKWLTQHLTDRYFSHRAYYVIKVGKAIDNPDQRICDEVRAFTGTSLSFLLIIFNSCITLFSFTGVLWSISNTLTWVLVGYAILGSLTAMLFGKRLIGLNFLQLKREADLRYGLIHVRDNAESIAFYRGEARERGHIVERFTDVVTNSTSLIAWHRNLGFFTTGYNHLASILPSIIVAPQYLQGHVEFGVITQATFAFGWVLGALSLIVVQFERLTAFAADIGRLGTFWDALDDAADGANDLGSHIDVRQGTRLEFQHVSLLTPTRSRVLIRDLSFIVDAGQGLLISGQSGCGKSSLLRGIAGLWTAGEGRIIRPPLDQIMFVPQRPYMVLGTLRDQLTFSAEQQAITDEQLLKVMSDVLLEDLFNKVDGFETKMDWQNILSLGEQQRIAFARVLLRKPKLLFLDEATSALDVATEERLYKLLRQSLGTTYISVGHRPSLVPHHSVILDLDGTGAWKLKPITPVPA